MSDQLLVIDACSILNFAAINRIWLLEHILHDRGRWLQAVAGEVGRLANQARYASARTLLDGQSLGQPIELDAPADHHAVQDIRAALGGTSSAPLRHLGEAESIHAIETRTDLTDAIFLTDDRDATYLASRRGIVVRDTIWLLADAYRAGDLCCPEPFDLLIAMREAERGIVLPGSHHSVCP